MTARRRKSQNLKPTLELRAFQDDDAGDTQAPISDPRSLCSEENARFPKAYSASVNAHLERDCLHERFERRLKESVAAILDAIIDQAQAGSVPAAKIVLERVLPDPRNRLLSFDIRKIKDLRSAIAALGDVINAAGESKITLNEAESINRLLKNYIELNALREFSIRMSKLETLVKKHG